MFRADNEEASTSFPLTRQGEKFAKCEKIHREDLPVLRPDGSGLLSGRGRS
jgi:hypothetical protein